MPIGRDNDEPAYSAGMKADASRRPVPDGVVLHCDMERTCTSQVTHVDDGGYVYCERHGKQLHASGRRCRVLLGRELRELQASRTINYDAART